MKRKQSQYAIQCNYNNGPIFGNDRSSDISIEYKNNKCTCSINNNCNYAYDCNSKYQSLLFTNSNSIEILDYEVFTIDYQGKETIYYICKYPDIIWNYIQTNNIPKSTIAQLKDGNELRNDLELIHDHNKAIFLKIIKYSIHHHTSFLLGSTIIDYQYDSYLREWVGNYSMRMIYRASDYGYTANSFHEHCDNQGSTLVVIMNEHGWIFGGYTTQSWNERSNKIYHSIYIVYVLYVV